MKIYVSHSRNFDYKKELYEPLRNSGIHAEYIFPHENSDEPFNTKELFEQKGCDLVLAEVSTPSTGQGIELGWANIFKIPILCFFKEGSKISSSLYLISSNIKAYNATKDLTDGLTIYLNQNIA